MVNLIRKLFKPKNGKIQIEEGNNKFIHFKEENIEGIVSKDMIWHEDIYKFLQDEIKEKSIVGGGRIELDRKEKKIEIYGSSGSYGSTNQIHVKEILQEYFGPDYEITTSQEEELEQVKQREAKKNATLESIATNENIQKSLDKLPISKKIKLYQQTGINKLSADEVKSYIVDSLEGGYNFNESISLVQEFNLGSDKKLKKEFLSEKSKRHMRGGIEFYGGDYGNRVSGGTAQTFSSLKGYLFGLEEVFTISREDMQPLAKSIIDENVIISKKAGKKFKIPLLEESQTIAKKFGLEDNLVNGLIKKKITSRFNNLDWCESEVELSNLKLAIEELPKVNRNSYVALQALEYISKIKEFESKGGDDYWPSKGMEFLHGFLTNFNEILGDKQLQTLEERLKENSLDFIESRKGTRGSHLEESWNLELIKKIIEDIPKLSEDIRNSIKKHASYPSLLSQGIITNKEYNNLIKQSSINSALTESCWGLDKKLEKLRINESSKIEIYKTALKKIANLESLTEENAYNFLKISEYLYQLKLEIPKIVSDSYNRIYNMLKEDDTTGMKNKLYDLATKTGNAVKQEEIARAVIKKSILKNEPSHYLYGVRQFFKRDDIDASLYETELESGLEDSLKDDAEKESYFNHMYFDLGLKTDNREEQIEYLLQEQLSYTIRHLGEIHITHSIYYIMDFIEEHKVGRNLYMPKIDTLIKKAIENGKIDIAESYARKYDHPFNQELKVLREIL